MYVSAFKINHFLNCWLKLPNLIRPAVWGANVSNVSKCIMLTYAMSVATVRFIHTLGVKLWKRPCPLWPRALVKFLCKKMDAVTHLDKFLAVTWSKLWRSCNSTVQTRKTICSSLTKHATYYGWQWSWHCHELSFLIFSLSLLLICILYVSRKGKIETN